jgi:hypothetical protein
VPSFAARLPPARSVGATDLLKVFHDEFPLGSISYGYEEGFSPRMFGASREKG